VFSVMLAGAALALVLLYREKLPMGILLGIFALTPIDPMLSHWADNEQRGHYFGYWFGHDMFTPPFGIYPEMEYNTILFGGTDPGRFNPTYMIFCESFIPPSKKPMDPKFDRRDVYLITQNALADGTYLSYIRAHYNRSAQIDPPFFVNFFRTANEEAEGTTNAFAKLWVPVDNFFTHLGAEVEARRRREGVYPKKEIITPSVHDSEVAFSNYIADASIRLQHDMQFPNEPKKIRPGEDVRYVDGRVSVSGQVAVMAINGLLTKDIFDANPTNAFYVEESFPLDWMFPYLSPYGIIMKINRNPVPEVTQDMVVKDHEFWSKYSDRFIGNWITYDTPVKDLCAFAEKVYLRRDFNGFKGSPAFVRDDNAQKAFSKLRSAIGGLYYWHLNVAKTPIENARVLKEAEFAFKQSFAFCPYSPEAVYKYVNLLVNLQRPEEAELIVNTCLKFDPENPTMHGLLQNLQDIKKGQTQTQAAKSQLSVIEARYNSNPADLNVAFEMASAYLSLQRTNEANGVLERLVQQTNASPTTLLSVANAYQQLQNINGLEMTLAKLTKVLPENPEAWYDLARAQVMTRKTAEAMKSLRTAVMLSNKRLATNASAKNLAVEAQSDPTFAGIRGSPEFSKAIKPQEP
jgi:thioredoxin-like negative regulator of GroEL